MRSFVKIKSTTYPRRGGGGGGGEGGTLKFLYIRWLGLFFGFEALKFNIFGGFQKKLFHGV